MKNSTPFLLSVCPAMGREKRKAMCPRACPVKFVMATRTWIGGVAQAN